jgi:hypothetical protein
MGRTHAGTCVILLVQDLQTRVINAATGELLRDPTLEPSRDYQPTGARRDPAAKPRNEQHPDLHSQVRVSPIPETSQL